MTSALMRSASVDANYRSYLAGKVDSRGSSLLSGICDPDWETCAIGLLDANATGNSTAPTVVRPSMWINIYGLYSLLMIIEGYLTYNAFTSHMSTLNTSNTGKTLWTVSWLEGTQPLSGWMWLSYILIATNSWTFVGYLISLASPDAMAFFRFSQLSLMWPIMTISFTLAAYFNYK